MPTLLLADDSLAIQKVVRLLFEDSRFDLAIVANGDEALERAREERPAAVLADVHMPGASGYDVAREIKQLSPETPVLLLVGTFEPFDEERLAASGADGYLLKPFEGAELRRRIESLTGAPADAPPPAEAAPDEPGPDEPAPDEPSSEPDRPSSEDDEREAGAEEPPSPDGEPTASDAEPRSPESASSPEPEPVSEAAAAPDGDSRVATPGLAEADVERVARRVVELMSSEAVREIAAEVVPRIAEEAVSRRIAELEGEPSDSQ